MLRRVVSFAVTFLIANSTITYAASDPAAAPATPLTAAVSRAAKEAAPEIAPWAVHEPEQRPKALLAMYGAYAGIQVMDVVSTRKAIAAGARESNPVMGDGNVGRMIAVKAATGVSTIYFAERMWKKNRVGAVIVMAALNGASAAIVARNQRNARR